MNKISMAKKYITRDGRAVRIVALDVKNKAYSVVGLVMDKDGEEHQQSFTSIGEYYSNGEECEVDLIEVEPFKKNDLVMVQHYTGSKWLRRYFHSMNGSQFRTYDDGRTSWSGGDLVSSWDICRAYDAMKDGE